MEKDKLLPLVSPKLSNITFEEEAPIFRGEYRSNESLIAIYFIDYGINDMNFDIQEYQEKYISGDYYNNPGYLQWNFYLIFVRESAIDISLKNNLESNDSYTRKFIFTPEQLENYFTYQKAEKTIESDIISSWKEKLKTVDLDEVYSQAAYTQAIARFISGDVIKDNLAEQDTATNSRSIVIIKRISTLLLKPEYRPYPLIRHFEFGKVNLIRGVNGSGKTSLLEAIELVIGGKCNRNPDFKENNNSISAIYNGNFSERDEYAPNDNTKYRSRDSLWYSRSYKAGNVLHLAFNRYNFYDADAAYKLSNNSDETKISTYLSSIALGTEFNYIQERLKGFRERLNKEARDREKQVAEEENRAIKANETLNSTDGNINPQSYFDLFITTAKEVSWKATLPKNLDSDTSLFEKDYQTATSSIDSISRLLISAKLRTLKSMNDELKEINVNIDIYNDIKKQLAEITNQTTQRNSTLKKASSDLEILNTAEKFFNNSDSFELNQLDSRLSVLSSNISKNTRFITLFEEVSTSSLFVRIDTFITVKNEYSEKREDLRKKAKKLNEEISALRTNLDKLQQIVSDIKILGGQYLGLNSEASFCPLCETPYSHGELFNRISNISENIAENAAIGIINNQVTDIEKELISLENSIKDLDIIEKALGIIYPSDYRNLKLNTINKEAEAIKSALEADKTEQLRLSSLKEGLNEKGLLESDFNKTKRDIESNFNDFSFVYKSEVVFRNLLAEATRQTQEITNSQEKDKTQTDELNGRLRKINIVTSTPLSQSDLGKELSYRKEILTKGIETFSKLNEFISINENDDINDLQQKIESVYGLYQRFLKLLSDQSQFRLAKKIIDDAEKKKNELSPVISKMKNALNTIDDILNNDNESKVLGHFFQENEQEIQEIFQNLHAPREFSKIKFNYELNTVTLTRHNNATEEPLSKISTGQRNALALSIFLSLNKKLKKGPNLIIFDDPVAFIDDLNILSFLDYLREITINEDRQIFFATANQKLAGLFEKKFGFLSEEGRKTFVLERQTNTVPLN